MERKRASNDDVEMQEDEDGDGRWKMDADADAGADGVEQGRAREAGNKSVGDLVALL